jgi:hypothetical protein
MSRYVDIHFIYKCHSFIYFCLFIFFIIYLQIYLYSYYLYMFLYNLFIYLVFVYWSQWLNTGWQKFGSNVFLRS